MNPTNSYTALPDQPRMRPAARLRRSRAPFLRSGATRTSSLVLALITLLYVAVSFTPVIFDDNEGLYAGSVREMHQAGNWLVPLTNGFPRVQKPPLVYWTMLVSTSLLGENEFALRLPNALATAGWIIATYLIMRRLGGERFGLASAVVLASMLGVWVFNHLVQPEPFLACFISLALWCLIEARLTCKPASPPRPQPLLGERFPGDNWYLAFWLCLALGAMSKGLHGALWPLGTALLGAIFVPAWRPWLRPILTLRGILLFFALLAPWYLYMAARFPGFLSAHFLNEQLGACLNTRYPADARQLPLWQFYAQHLLFWMPWTMLLPGAILVAAKSMRRLPSVTLDLVKMLACWFALTLISVAFSTRQDYYSMSCWGVAAGFLALPWLSREIPRRFLLVPCALVTMGGAASLAFVAWITPRLHDLGQATAAPIRERDTFMDAIAGISPALWAQFITLLGIFGAAMLIAGGASTLLAWQRRSWPALLVLASGMAAPIILAAAGFTMMSPYFSLAEGARAINREIAAEPTALVACEALPNTASSLLYYLNAPVHWVNAPFNQDYPQRVLGLGRDDYWDESTTLREWTSPQPVYLIIEGDRLDFWQGKFPPGARIVLKTGTRIILSNR